MLLRWSVSGGSPAANDTQEGKISFPFFLTESSVRIKLFFSRLSVSGLKAAAIHSPLHIQVGEEEEEEEWVWLADSLMTGWLLNHRDDPSVFAGNPPETYTSLYFFF